MKFLYVKQPQIKSKMSQGKNCPHFTEILNFLADPLDPADFNHNIDELGDCTECENGVCSLWVSCLFVSDFSQRVGLPELKSIEDLDAYMEKIAVDLVMGRTSNQKANVPFNKPQYPVKVFENMIPLRAENNNNYIRSNLQKAYDAFHQEDYETAVLLFRMLLTDYNKPEELNLYAAVSYFFAADYENAVTFMNYYSEKPYGYDRVMGNAFIDLCCDKMKFNLGS